MNRDWYLQEQVERHLSGQAIAIPTEEVVLFWLMVKQEKRKRQETVFSQHQSFWVAAVATPLADLQASKLLHRGYSASFEAAGGSAEVLLRLETYHAIRKAMLPRWYRRVLPWLRAAWR